MKQRPIELRQLRDFGQVINDTFTFYKKNLKPLMKPLIIICGFFIVLQTVATIFTYFNRAETMRVGFYSPREYHESSYYLSMGIQYILAYLTHVSIGLVTLSYIAVYVQNGNTQPTFAQVWGFFKYYFFRVLFSGIPLFILIIIATVLCILPGIWIGTIFSLFLPIMVIENSSFSYAFNKCFKLISGNWWFVFGVAVIMILILLVVNVMAVAPFSLGVVALRLITEKSIISPLIILVSLLQSMVLLIYPLYSIAAAMCYFDLCEQKESIGLLQRIENFGKQGGTDSPASLLPAEDY
jgi:hypothetical protein